MTLCATAETRDVTDVSHPPVRSPDGKRLTAASGNAVWMIDPETGARWLAIQFPQNFRVQFRAAWTPDGNAVIVNRQERVSHIVLMENF